MYLINAMEISISLEVLCPKYYAQLVDTLPSFWTLHAQLLDTPYTTGNNNIIVKCMYILVRNILCTSTYLQQLKTCIKIHVKMLV